MTISPARILVVDDEAPLRTLLSRFLQLEHHEVITAENGAQALSLVAERQPDLVLLDINMPVMSGMEALRRLKADPLTRDVPVVMISSEMDVDGIASCLKLGAEDYLPKPFNPVILSARVSACLERRRLQLQERAYRDQLEHRVEVHSALAAQHAEARAQSDAALQRQSEILRSVFASLGEGVIVVDSGGVLIHHNPAARQILGARLALLIPATRAETSVFQTAQGTPLLAYELPLARALAGEKVDGLELFLPLEGNDGQWLSVSARPLGGAGDPNGGAVMVLRDISASKRANLALRESEERYALAARGANDGLWDWDLRTNQIYYSPRWKAMLGFAEHELGTDPAEWFERVHPDDRERLEIHLQAHFRRLITHFQHEYRIRASDQSYRWMLCRGLAVWDAHGTATRIVGSQTDITDRKRAEQRLLHDAFHDGLTGLPNRMLFLDRLKHAILRNRRSEGHSFAVMFLDLDRFKVINDSLGHSAGDALLEEIARRLEHSMRPGDTAARLGGDEFAILLEDISSSEAALAISERIQQAIAMPLRLNDREMFTTASIGITLYQPGYESAADLIRDADTAMYHAKMRGKACAVVFDPAMHAAAMEQLQVETALRWAVERDELRLHYQPIVALDSQRIEGFEALIRWQHPQRGLLFPRDFIAIAEETGLIVPIGWWVLREACRQLKRWQNEVPGAETLWVTVNLSARQLVQPDVVQIVLGVLDEHQLAAQALKLEITETALVNSSQQVREALSELRAAGVKICIDDFGTGYSSLSYLQRLPVDILKIDRSFIQTIEETGDQGAIVGNIIALASVLGLEAVAEGTETASQVQRLRDLHCSYGQGWLFSKPLKPTDAVGLLLKQPATLPDVSLPAPSE
ncbi:MAG: EAL domain-containing protein [Chloroflexi bacterium]|nr:EAL domain-containing protein [Chloroflexota bacterium]